MAYSLSKPGSQTSKKLLELPGLFGPFFFVGLVRKGDDA